MNAHDPSEGAGAWIGEEDASSRDRIRAQLALTPRQRLAGSAAPTSCIATASSSAAAP